MKAMIIKNFGDATVFEPVQIDKPVIKPGHVLVKIAATSINTVDTIQEPGMDVTPLSETWYPVQNG
jgi:NADPH2:quinone reductase